jgi:predicted tellurium resistance membrane protein TerC
MELSPDLLVAFLTLFVLELILGVDNVVFISILVNRLPAHQQQRARIIGLSLAMILRIVLLFFATWIVGLTEPLFGWGETETWQFSGRDLILLVGGLFLIYKATMEIHHKLEGEEDKSAGQQATSTFGRVILQIIAIDAVFSLDSVITAVGMTDEIIVMIAAVVLSIGLMMFIARQIGEFVNRHPSVKLLALSFLLLIGASLVAEGFGVHIDKPLIYGPIAFAIGVETLNLLYRRRQAKKADTERAPVQLHGDKRVGVRAGTDGATR